MTAATGVPQRKLGSTGELVSLLGLGGAHIGQKSLSDAEAIQIMHEAIDGGITFFDNLPTSVVITGIDSKQVLAQDLNLARTFLPLTPEERVSLLARSAPEAKSGEHELFKTARKYDGTAKHPKWLESAEI